VKDARREIVHVLRHPDMTRDARPGALIFDMDSLLARTMPVWREAESHLLGLLGDRYSEEWVAKYRGMNAADVAKVIHDELRPAMPLAECRRILREKLVEAYGRMGQDDVKPMPGAIELVTRLAPSYRMAVASGSPEAGIRAALTRLEILQHFQVVLSSESVERGKPEPDVFLAAARKLGSEPAACLVFEDSLAGVRAARAAGMTCFAVPSEARDEIANVAARSFASLAEIGDEDVATALRPGSEGRA
jgi:HAD superfamily hydrolase (TIGR01509 family)